MDRMFDIVYVRVYEYSVSSDLSRLFWRYPISFKTVLITKVQVDDVELETFRTLKGTCWLTTAWAFPWRRLFLCGFRLWLPDWRHCLVKRVLSKNNFQSSNWGIHNNTGSLILKWKCKGSAEMERDSTLRQTGTTVKEYHLLISLPMFPFDGRLCK